MLIITRRLLNYELTCGSSKIALFHSCERWCPERVRGRGSRFLPREEKVLIISLTMWEVLVDNFI